MGNKDRDDRLVLTGEVIASNKGIFKVLVNEGHVVTCRISGRLRINDIKLVIGDRTRVEVSPYNLDLGRIVQRLKPGEQ